jgi:hypothetical protein
MKSDVTKMVDKNLAQVIPIDGGAPQRKHRSSSDVCEVNFI